MGSMSNHDSLNILRAACVKSYATLKLVMLKAITIWHTNLNLFHLKLWLQFLRKAQKAIMYSAHFIEQSAFTSATMTDMFHHTPCPVEERDLNCSCQGLKGGDGQAPHPPVHLRGGIGRWGDQALRRSTHWKVPPPVCSPPQACLEGLIKMSSCAWCEITICLPGCCLPFCRQSGSLIGELTRFVIKSFDISHLCRTCLWMSFTYCRFIRR